MADNRAHLIAQTLMQIAQTISPGQIRADVPRIAGESLPQQDVDSIASLIRALCPPTAGTTNVADVAAMVRAISPAEAAIIDATGVARLIQALSPAAEKGGRDRLRALIVALSPAAPADRINAITETFAKGNLKQQADAVREALELSGEAAAAPGRLSPRQQQAVDVMRELWPVAKQPKKSVDEAARFVRELSPPDRPAREVAALIAALSPAQDNTISSAGDAVKFIAALCPAGNVPAADVAPLIRALSPADDRAARKTENVAAVIRALCPAGGDEVGALIRALSPADDPTSRPVEIAKLIRALLPAEITPVQVIRTLSPASQ